MTTKDMSRRYILGLDLGVSSIGWALVDANDSAAPETRIIRAGVHLFEAGVDGGKQDSEAAMETGREKSRALPRRDARQQRRQTWRRAFRKRSLLKCLIRHGLLPEPEHRLASPMDIDTYLKQLDAVLRETWESKLDADIAADERKEFHRIRQLLPYRLRAEALRRKLESYEVGRALYHLAQRRGFLSNRKTDDDESSEDDLSNRKTDDDESSEDDKNTGKVKAGMSELEKLMKTADANTLGEYFASLDPSNAEHRRVRGRWTARTMYENEFNLIWTEQSKHHPDVMTDGARREIRRAIFFQRPLKSQSHLIGKCSLIPTKRRSPVADRLYQRFRMIQKINDLKIIPQIEEVDFDPKTGEVKKNPKTGKPKMKRRLVPDPQQSERPLSPDERQAAIALLSLGKATFHQLRQAGAAPKKSRFNFEKEGVTELPGHRTDEEFRKVFGERWDQFSDDVKDAAVEDWLSIVRADVMEKRGREHWKLSAENARAFARIKLEEGYANLSRAAIRRLLPQMEQGKPYATVRHKEFPESFAPTSPLDFLPALNPPKRPSLKRLNMPTPVFADPVSPAVERALSEMRRVVNAIIRRYGKPEHVRIELARDLKRGRKRREAISKNMRNRHKQREAAANRLLKQYPSRGSKPEDVSGTDILKVMLADECNWICPYTGRSFGWDDVFGAHPTIDIEHIWPFKRSLDNSFINKTLCCINENRNVKRNRMPSEAYSIDRLEEILQRVSRFKGDAAKAKLDRFKAESIPSDFTNRHLSESRYVSRKAAEYIALLYGGYTDEDHKRRVHVPSGGLTAWLRREWRMNAILSDRNEKDRQDHRHHAIDAIIVAFTTPSVIKNLQESAARSDNAGSPRLFAGLEPPFNFEDARRAIEAIVISHRQNKKARGKFHKDTIYSKPLPSTNGNQSHRIRKELHKLNEKEIESIVDPRIRDLVRAAYGRRRQEGAKNPSQAFSEEKYRPQLPHGDRVRRVRLFTSAKPNMIGSGNGDRKQRGETKKRRVDLQANHHTVIMAKLDNNGNEQTWVDEPVSLFDALERVKQGQPLVSRDVPDGYRFKFSLAKNDFLRFKNVKGFEPGLYRVLSISDGDIECVSHTDGRTSTERKQAKARVRLRRTAISEGGFEKVHVTYLGEVKSAGG